MASLLLLAGAGLVAPLAGAAAPPNFTNASLAGLVDTSGRTLPADPYPGRYRLVLFGFASCADVCPLTLLALRESMKKLGGDARRVVPIFISVDPERDRAEDLRKYVRAFDERIQGLTGTPEVLRRVAAAHGVFFEKRWVDVSANAYVFDHTASVLLIGPDGRLLATVSSAGPPADVATRVADAFKKARR